MDLSYIIAPLLGGVIGYITNDIAIRMLFRPHTATTMLVTFQQERRNAFIVEMNI